MWEGDPILYSMGGFVGLRCFFPWIMLFPIPFVIGDSSLDIGRTICILTSLIVVCLWIGVCSKFV